MSSNFFPPLEAAYCRASSTCYSHTCCIPTLLPCLLLMMELCSFIAFIPPWRCSCLPYGCNPNNFLDLSQWVSHSRASPGEQQPLVDITTQEKDMGAPAGSSCAPWLLQLRWDPEATHQLVLEQERPRELCFIGAWR